MCFMHKGTSSDMNLFRIKCVFIQRFHRFRSKCIKKHFNLCDILRQALLFTHIETNFLAFFSHVGFFSNFSKPVFTFNLVFTVWFMSPLSNKWVFNLKFAYFCHSFGKFKLQLLYIFSQKLSLKCWVWKEYAILTKITGELFLVKGHLKIILCSFVNIKVPLSNLRQFLAAESPLNILKQTFFWNQQVCLNTNDI